MTTIRNTLLKFPASVKTPSPETYQQTSLLLGPPRRPAARTLRSDLVLRQARQTRNVVTVARRLGVRCNDIFLVVLDCLDERRAA